MVTSSRYFEAPQRRRAFVRAHETSLVVLALLVGTVGGLVVAAMSIAVEALHVVFFNLEWGDRLSSQFRIETWRALLVPSIGGLLLGLAFLLLLRWRPSREIDPIEANALHGGMMSFRGSVIVALQTVWSSGVGGSVGLEAGFARGEFDLVAVGRASPWVALVIVAREFTILGLRAAIAAGGVRIMETSMLGKWKATIQFVAIALAILRPEVTIAGAYLDQWAMVIAAAVTAWSGADYLARSTDALRS